MHACPVFLKFWPSFASTHEENYSNLNNNSNNNILKLLATNVGVMMLLGCYAKRLIDKKLFYE